MRVVAVAIRVADACFAGEVARGGVIGVIFLGVGTPNPSTGNSVLQPVDVSG